MDHGPCREMKSTRLLSLSEADSGWATLAMLVPTQTSLAVSISETVSATKTFLS